MAGDAEAAAESNSARSLASFILRYSSSQSTHSNSLLPTPSPKPTPSADSGASDPASVSCNFSPGCLLSPVVDGDAGTPPSPVHDEARSCPGENDPTELFHFRILALRLAKMIWAYSLVFSPLRSDRRWLCGSRLPPGAIEVRCMDNEPLPLPGCRCDDIRRMPAPCRSSDAEASASGDKPSVSGETPESGC